MLTGRGTVSFSRMSTPCNILLSYKPVVADVDLLKPAVRVSSDLVSKLK
jgi:hypothetical protein